MAQQAPQNSKIWRVIRPENGQSGHRIEWDSLRVVKIPFLCKFQAVLVQKINFLCVLIPPSGRFVDHLAGHGGGSDSSAFEFAVDVQRGIRGFAA
uniref:Uncharacterized protein n=1 Tax=Bursaphelenchus xylophilus TaxID=6326 RepID=A0A1I7SN83_BURXY